MIDFLRGLKYIMIEYALTFKFYKQGVYKFFKCISILIFIIPATIFALLTLICAGINIVISKALIIGLIWSIVVCGILNLITMFMFWMCNIFELKDYRYFFEENTRYI